MDRHIRTASKLEAVKKSDMLFKIRNKNLSVAKMATKTTHTSKVTL